MKTLLPCRMTVCLESAVNPDFGVGGCNNQWNRKISPVWVECDSLEHASVICRAFIHNNDLGGGNWTGGQVIDDESKSLGRVAYNGRIIA